MGTSGCWAQTFCIACGDARVRPTCRYQSIGCKRAASPAAACSAQGLPGCGSTATAAAAQRCYGLRGVWEVIATDRLVPACRGVDGVKERHGRVAVAANCCSGSRGPAPARRPPAMPTRLSKSCAPPRSSAWSPSAPPSRSPDASWPAVRETSDPTRCQTAGRSSPRSPGRGVSPSDMERRQCELESCLRQTENMPPRRCRDGRCPFVAMGDALATRRKATESQCSMVKISIIKFAKRFVPTSTGAMA